MRNPHVIVLELDELHTILAALRLWQQKGYTDPACRPLDLHEIACPDDETISLDPAGIDELCERINCDSLEIRAETDGLELIRYVRRLQFTDRQTRAE